MSVWMWVEGVRVCGGPGGGGGGEAAALPKILYNGGFVL